MNINIPNPGIPNEVMLDWLERDRTSDEVHVFVVGGTDQERKALASFIGLQYPKVDKNPCNLCGGTGYYRPLPDGPFDPKPIEPCPLCKRNTE